MTDPFRQFFLDTIETILQEEPNEDSLYKLLVTTSPNLSLDHIINARSISDSSASSSASSSVSSTTTLTTGTTTNEKRSKALRTLKSRIHPDKHPHDKRATYLFQNIQIFYDECCAAIESQSSTPSGSSSSSSSCKSTGGGGGSSSKRGSKRHRPLSEQRFPLDFDAMEKWPHMKLHHPKIPPNDPNPTKSPSSPTTPNNVSNSLPLIQAFKCLNGRGALAHGRPITRHFLTTDTTTTSRFRIWEVGMGG